MKLVHIVLVILLSCMSYLAQASDLLTEARLEQLVQSIDKAVQQRDAQAVTEHFTNDAVIILRFGQSLPGMKYSREEYQQRIQRAWSMPMEHDYQSHGASITVSKDGKSAIIDNNALERVSMDGEDVMVTNMQEKWHVITEQGEPKITKLEGLYTLN
jgi:ketosteroid isomerase-like protein